MLMLSFYLFMSMGMVSCLFTSNPTFLIIWLIILSFNIGMVISNFISLWMTYAVILLFTGGMMVLFSYMVTLTSTLKIIFQNFSTITFIIWMSINIVFIQPSFMFLQNMNLSKLFVFSSFFIMVSLVFYLLLALMTVVKMATSLSGPMKSFFKNEIM